MVSLLILSFKKYIVSITCRGETFRKVMLRTGDIHSLIPRDVRMLALTAAATAKLRVQVTLTLGMTDELVVSLSPCKANIMYSVMSMTTVADTFLPMVERLRKERISFPRTISITGVMRTVQSSTNYSEITSH